MESEDDTGFESAEAFVAVLFGSHPEFLVCALLLGDSLERLCPGIVDRFLLVSEDSDFAYGEEACALECFWQLTRVQPIVIANATRSVRHAAVFTKLHLFSVRARRLLFLDLDILVRSARLAELFDVPGPAGMLHGHPPEGRTLRHGELIGDSCFHLDGNDPFCACINTGVMRIDLEPSQRRRDAFRRELEMRAREIPAEEATMLPEQYFLARHLQGWRHIHSAWNWEVGPSVEIRDRDVRVHTVGEWAEVQINDVIVYHFSGRRCLPWHYFDLSPSAAFAEVRRRFNWRDPQDRIARAVSEWCSALEDLVNRANRGAFHDTEASMSNRSRAGRCVKTVLSHHVGKLIGNAPAKRYRDSIDCPACWQQSLDSVPAGRDCWLCPSCGLWNVRMQSSVPAEPLLENLVGRWLDYYGADEDVAHLSLQDDSQSIHVHFGDWHGQLVVASRESLTITWDDAGDDEGWWRTINGELQGETILWENRSVWVHIG